MGNYPNSHQYFTTVRRKQRYFLLRDALYSRGKIVLPRFFMNQSHLGSSDHAHTACHVQYSRHALKM